MKLKKSRCKETRCVVKGCKRVATMDSPADFCDKHWHGWFNADPLMKKYSRVG